MSKRSNVYIETPKYNYRLFSLFLLRSTYELVMFLIPKFPILSTIYTLLSLLNPFISLFEWMGKLFSDVFNFPRSSSFYFLSF